MLETWFLLSLISVIVLTLSEFLQQHVLNHKDPDENFSPMESMLFTSGFRFIILSIIIFFISGQLNIFPYLNFITSSVFIFVIILNWFMTITYIKSFQVKSISLSSIFLGMAPVVAMFLGWLFMGEKIYFEKVLGVFLILFSSILVFWKSIYFEKKHYFAMISALLYGILIIADSFLIKEIPEINPVIYFFWRTFFIVLFGALFYHKIISDKIKKTKIKKFKNVFLISINFLIFDLAVFFAYKFGGEAGRIDAINNFEIFLIILFEYFFLKQKQDLWLKITSFVLSLIGVILLGMF